MFIILDPPMFDGMAIALGSPDDPELRRFQVMLCVLTASPFPSPSIITEHIGRNWPNFTQREVYVVTQGVKKQIARLQTADDCHKQSHACN